MLCQHNGDLPHTAKNLISIKPRTPVMYFLPKIHKPDNPGRPIVSACGCPTELISSYLDHVMAPLEQYTDPTPDYLGRYIDDCVGTASCSCGELEQFINYVNNFHPALQFTWEISETSVSFLDILISINGNRLVTSVFYKPTDSYSYLLYSSSNPNHTKRSIPFSQFLCLRRLCSEDEDFHTKSLEMRDFVVQRGYPTSLLDTAFSKASQIPRSETLTNPVTNVTENNQIPLVLTFHPFNFKVRDIIRKNFHILKNDPETSSIFSNNPLVSFRHSKNI